jgi:hypothetical protein
MHSTGFFLTAVLTLLDVNHRALDWFLLSLLRVYFASQTIMQPSDTTGLFLIALLTLDDDNTFYCLVSNPLRIYLTSQTAMRL